MFTKVSITVFGAGLAIFTALNLTIQPSLEEQVVVARAVVERARTERQIAAAISINTASLQETDQPQDRKSLFIAMMLPLIAMENDRIRTQRNVIAQAGSVAQLSALATTYGLAPAHADREALLKRIDILPESLVLAQAALESGWGTSRFAREGNAFFGERTFDSTTPGIVPQRATGFKVKSFTAPAYSVRSYMRTLNSHKAYQALRDRRAALRSQGHYPSGAELAEHLGQYSEIGQEYIDRILTTITVNRLDLFDAITIADH